MRHGSESMGMRAMFKSSLFAVPVALSAVFAVAAFGAGDVSVCGMFGQDRGAEAAASSDDCGDDKDTCEASAKNDCGDGKDTCEVLAKEDCGDGKDNCEVLANGLVRLA